jgi:aminoglycoside/choline kinase family phosphotransferase
MIPHIIPTDTRQAALYQWVCEHFGQKILSWQALSGDAGARRYFRVQQAEQAYLAVDSPLTEVDNPRFIALAQGLGQAGLYAPTIYDAELSHGFLLINELSQLMYTDVLTADNVDALYTDALHALRLIQKSRPHYTVPINPWVEADFYAEMTDMPTWLLERHLHIQLSTLQHKSLEKLFKSLLENMREQPQVCVHKDYHGRNLLYCAQDAQGINSGGTNPGIIDFQDMFLGPITYDLVSLIRDAYITWPWTRVQSWITQFYQLIEHEHQFGEEQFNLWFHGMTLQRGIKILGRFPRLCYRDNKPAYLGDLPSVVSFVLESCPFYSNTAVLEDLLQEQVLPQLELACAR